MRVRVGRVEVVDVAGCDEREPSLRRERRELVEDRLLDVETRVLQLDVHVVVAEELLEPIELLLGVTVTTFRERA